MRLAYGIIKGFGWVCRLLHFFLLSFFPKELMHYVLISWASLKKGQVFILITIAAHVLLKYQESFECCSLACLYKRILQLTAVYFLEILVYFSQL